MISQKFILFFCFYTFRDGPHKHQFGNIYKYAIVTHLFFLYWNHTQSHEPCLRRQQPRAIQHIPIRSQRYMIFDVLVIHTFLLVSLPSYLNVFSKSYTIWYPPIILSMIRLKRIIVKEFFPWPISISIYTKKYLFIFLRKKINRYLHLILFLLSLW